jgi:hypothetical protein
MRRLPQPIENARVVFTTCIGNFRKITKDKLAAVSDEIEHAANEYHSFAQRTRLNEIQRADKVGNDVTSEEMKKVYTEKMVPKDQPGRIFYDTIIASPTLGICPLCGVGKVSTLDHHLPKSEYPTLVVTPVNLIPACTWCQGEKREVFPRTDGEQTFHPYYDNVEQERWLKAEIRKTAPVSFVFDVSSPTSWNGTILKVRAIRHLEVFNLNELFSTNAASELVNIRHRLLDLYNKGGKQLVKAHLLEEARSRENAHKNSWQTAMYYGMAESDWFCDNGFSLI